MPVVKTILEIIAQHNVILHTAHLPIGEIKILIPEAKKIGVQKIVVTHPEFREINMSIKDQKELAANKGVYFERCCVNSIPPNKVSVPSFVSAIREVGVESTVLATDLGQAHNPWPEEGLLSFIEAMLEHGFTGAELEIMLKTNPARLLDL